MKKIITISAFISGRDKVYVKSLSDYSGLKKIAITTSDKKEALDFGSRDKAEIVLSNIHNPLERNYKVDVIEVSKKSVRKIESDLS